MIRKLLAVVILCCMSGCVGTSKTNGGTRVRTLSIGTPFTISYTDSTSSEDFWTEDIITSAPLDSLLAGGGNATPKFTVNNPTPNSTDKNATPKLSDKNATDNLSDKK